MQELTFTQAKHVAGGFQGLTGPGEHNRPDPFTLDSKNEDGSTFWGGIGAGIGSAFDSLGKAVNKAAQSLNDVTSTVKNYFDSKNIANACGGPGNVKQYTTTPEGITVICKD